jgi:DNA-binding transcriptional LysR family regulator
MTLEQLRIFVFVAERLHMTRAAHALGLTQSAASAGVAALESRYDVRLFDRVGRGIELSEAGRLFLPEARAVLRQAERAAQTLEDLTGLRRGALALAASQTVASYWLPTRMARFADAFPGVSLHLTVGNTAQVAQDVLNGAADLGFVEGAIDTPALARQRIGADRIAIYAAPSHPLAEVNVTLDDLRSARWALREPGSGTRAAFEQALASKGVAPGALQVALELPSNEAALAAVSDGALLTAVSELAAQPLVAAGRLHRLAIDMADRNFDLLTHRERRRSAAAQAFISHI